MNCSKIISMNIGDVCAPIVKGYKDKAVIINYDDIDWDNITREEGNEHVIKSLSLLSGKYGYRVTQRGANPFNGTNSAMAATEYQNETTNTVQVLIPRDAENTNAIAQPLANGAVVVMILESKSHGADGNSAFEIVGLDGGLVATANTSDINGDAGKNFIFTLTETTTNVATFVNAGTYASTKLMVDGLINNA